MVLILTAAGSLFLVLFLGGLVSAALEVRSERRAGVPVTRPAWDRARARRESGGRFATLRGYWKGLTASPAAPSGPPGPCEVCGCTIFLMDDRPTGCVWVCADDFNGKPDSEHAHNLASLSTWDDRHAS